MKNIYTDLALEEREKFNGDIQIEGVESYQKKENSVNMLTTVVKIVNEKGKETMDKPIGSYITMESPKIRYSKEAHRRELGKFLCNYLKEITSKENIKSILIVGLGNSMATPDALGPKTARDIICTKNIYCMAPGVLSQTGMETYDIIKGVVSQIDPDLIIAIDSLAARNVRRITTTIQFGQDVTCPALLIVFLVPCTGLRIRGCHPLWPAFPDRSAVTMHYQKLGYCGFARRYCRNLG